MAAWALLNGLILPSNSFIGFDYNPPKFAAVRPFETSWLYALLHIASVGPVFALSFDRKVHYYSRWKDLFPAILLVALFFIGWDIVFTSWQVWGFHSAYLTGPAFFGLPWEEVVFFLTVPFSSLFIYECLNAYITKDYLRRIERQITIGLIVALSAFGILYYDRIYTTTTCLLTASFLIWHLLRQPGIWRGRFYLAWLVSWIPFLLVDGVLTGGFTNEPIVLYHPPEFSGWRIVSIPIEDSLYSLLMLMGITTIYEYRKERRRELKR